MEYSLLTCANASKKLTMSIKLDEYLNERKTIIDAALDRYLPPASQPPSSVHEAMRYSTLNGGKRLRPILALAACDAVGGNIENALPAACAIECIHSFSLIHDDLPCMDNDDFRRGKPTAHKAFGEAIALLAGDALFALAFQIISETPSEVPPEIAIAVWKLIASATGTSGMVGGQVMDMLAEGRKPNFAEVTQIHKLKTGALIEISVTVGAMLGGGTADQVNALSAFGRNIGLAFQIADDVLDLKGDAAKLGKPIGSDLKHDKATYPSIIGIEQSEELAKKTMNDALQSISIFDEKAEPLRLIARFVVERES